MGHRSDELPGGIARQLRVGVERDDVFDRWKNRGLPDDLGKTFRATAAEQGVELHELSALALVTHPEAFACVPAARPMKQEKEIVPVGCVFAVQHFDSGPRPLEQRLSSGRISSGASRKSVSKAKCRC